MPRETADDICPKSRFEKDVTHHKMSIVRDDGVYRHLEFRHESGSANMYFGIITWPGYLHYYGDMGSYSFSRMHDMFEFFRRDDDYPIDFRYWAEKLTSVDRSASMSEGNDGVKRWSPENFGHCLRTSFSDHCEDREIEGAARQDLWDNRNGTRGDLNSVKNAVLPHADAGPVLAIAAAVDFSYVNEDGCEVYPFREFYEWGSSLYEYEFSFIWCCRALQWAVRQYDHCTVK